MFRLFDEQREVEEYETKCLDFASGESFLKYEKRKAYNTSEKLMVSSQPLAISNDAVLSQPPGVPSKHADSPSGEDQLASGMIRCKFCHEERIEVSPEQMSPKTIFTK